MTTFDTNRPAATAFPTPANPLRPIAEMVRLVRAAWRRRQAEITLSKLDDATLEDIGLHRGAIDPTRISRF